MARGFGFGIGPEINEVKAYQYAFDPVPTNLSIVTEAFNPQGTYLFKWANGGGDPLFTRGDGPQTWSKNYRWACFRLVRFSALSAAQQVLFAHFSNNDVQVASWNQIGIVYETATTCKFRLRNVNNGVTRDSVNAYAIDTNHSIRIEHRLSDKRLRLWVNGTLEIDEVEPNWALDSIPPAISLRGEILTSGQYVYTGGMAMYESDNEADRPGTTVWRSAMQPNGNTSETDYGNHADCLNAANGTYLNWDDWVSGGAADNDTTYNCGMETGGQETSDLTSFTAPVGLIMSGVRYYCRQAPNTANKTVQTYGRLKYSTNANEVLFSNLASTAYITAKAVFETPPGGGTWESPSAAAKQTLLDGLQGGHRVPASNDAHAKVSAIALEAFAVNDDPPAVPPTVGGRPYAAVIS